MTINIAFSRPLSVGLILLGIATTGGAAVWLAAENRAALVEERDAKVAFVGRSLAASRSPGPGPSPEAREASLAIEADSSTLAAARIDSLVRAAVIAAGGMVQSSRAEVKAGELVGGRDERIEIQVVVQGRMEALQAALYRLERGRPLVIVDDLAIRPVEEGAGDTQSPLLTETLTLSAFWSRPRS